MQDSISSGSRSTSSQHCMIQSFIMALHLGARTQGLGRLLQQVFKPACIAAALEGQCHQLLAGSNGAGSRYAEGIIGPQVEDERLRLSAPQLHWSGGNGGVANVIDGAVQFRTFGTDAAAAAVRDEGGAKENEDLLRADAEMTREGSDRTGLQLNEGARNTESSGGMVEKTHERADWSALPSEPKQKPRRPPAGSRLEMRGKLLNALRRWQPDIDLDMQFLGGKLDGKEIDVRVLRAVLFQMAKGPGRDRRGAVGGAPEEETDESPQYRCSKEDGRRALNAFHWWMRKDTGARRDPLEELLDPLLQVLAGAGMGEEIVELWEK